MQLQHLLRAGASVIYQEKTSSVGARPELRKLLAGIGPGHVLVVYKLDRIARSLKDLLEILEVLSACGAGLRSLTEPIDTASPVGRLMIQILGAVAEFERSLIRERSIAGQLAAINRGVRIGRPRLLTPDQEAEVLFLWKTGDWSKAALCRKYNVNDSVVRRVIYASERPGHVWVTENRPVLGPLLKSVK